MTSLKNPMKVNLLDHGYVQLIPSGTWGEDRSIIEAARMSTDKGFQGWGELTCINCGTKESEVDLDPTDDIIDNGICFDSYGHNFEHKVGDEKLLRYLWEHKHHTPFEMAGATFEVQAPLFVFREWHRHRTQSYNELSGRYTALPDLYYIPSIERLMNGKQATKNKQSSEAGFTEEQAIRFRDRYQNAVALARGEYERLLAEGVSKELARLVIPVNQYSRMRASANLRNWLGFLSLRQDPAAQWEIRQYANAVHDILRESFPRTMELFDAN